MEKVVNFLINFARVKQPRIMWSIKTPALPDPILTLSWGEVSPAKLHVFQGVRSAGLGGRRLGRRQWRLCLVY